MSKLTLITGAAGGLGRALTERLHGQAWPLALVSREAVLLAPLHRTSPEQYWEVVRANLDSAFFTLGAFVTSRP